LQGTQTDEVLITGYLLGELPEQEQTAVEARYFLDDAFFEQLVAAEKELIGRYVRGELSTEDHERFQRRYLTVGYRRKMVESAKELLLSGADRPALTVGTPGSTSWWKRFFGR
jgi:anti-sigma-K factor RskA